jgi:hypothetical protein
MKKNCWSTMTSKSLQKKVLVYEQALRAIIANCQCDAGHVKIALDALDASGEESDANQ